MRITAIGAANIDITVKSISQIVPGDFNQSNINFTAGGVARNIAAMLAVHGVQVGLIAAVGKDPLGNLLRENCADLGINTDMLISRKSTGTSIIVKTMESDGGQYVSFEATSSREAIIASDIVRHRKIIAESDLLFMDLSLAENILLTAIEHRAGNPIMVDVVDVEKVSRIKNIIEKVAILKLNRVQAEQLTGITLDSKERVMQACNIIVNRGVGRVFITLGMAGVCAGDEKGAIIVPAIPAMTKDLTGVGAAFSAGIAMHFGKDLREQAEQGVKLASQHLSRKA